MEGKIWFDININILIQYQHNLFQGSTPSSRMSIIPFTLKIKLVSFLFVSDHSVATGSVPLLTGMDSGWNYRWGQ